jgi:hypothetical protein
MQLLQTRQTPEEKAFYHTLVCCAPSVSDRERDASCDVHANACDRFKVGAAPEHLEMERSGKGGEALGTLHKIIVTDNASEVRVKRDAALRCVAKFNPAQSSSCLEQSFAQRCFRSLARGCRTSTRLRVLFAVRRAAPQAGLKLHGK